MFRIGTQILAAFAMLLGGAGAAAAGQDSATLAIKVVVVDACEIKGGTLDFGAYKANQRGDLLGQGAVTFADCSTDQVTIEIDGGAARDTNNRRMGTAGGGDLAYQVYRDADRTAPWGVGEQKLIRPISAGTGTFPVFGLIPGGQDAAPGTYSDVLNVTLTF